MQIIVDVPNSLYANLSKITNGSIATKRILDCVKYGTPLPKGHGRLLDEKEILASEDHDGGWYDLVDMPGYIAGVPAVIEADTEESGG